MLKVIFIIKKNKIKSSGECPIYAKVSLGLKTTLFTTGKSISEESWEATNRLNSFLKNDKEKVLKQSLDLFLLKIERAYNDLYRIDNDVSLEELKNNIIGKVKDDTVYLLSIFDQHNEDFRRSVEGGDRAPASLQKYMRSKDLIKAFLKKKYNQTDIDVKKVNGAFIYNLESFLRYESEFKGVVGIKNNSVVKYFKNFKTVCNYAIKIDLLDKNPFKKYDGKIKVTEAVYLTQEELNKIENTTFKVDRLERVKDIFLFSCYTGYAPVDACKLTSENLIKDNEGNVWINTTRTKTGTKANVPILTQSQRIIDKYQGMQKGLLPRLTNQKMNAYLKEIADICGINKHLTWYVSRHTFATTVTLGNGIKIENVSAMMGHSSIKQTQHYAKVLDVNVMKDMMKLRDKLS